MPECIGIKRKQAVMPVASTGYQKRGGNRRVRRNIWLVGQNVGSGYCSFKLFCFYRSGLGTKFIAMTGKQRPLFLLHLITSVTGCCMGEVLIVGLTLLMPLLLFLLKIMTKNQTLICPSDSTQLR